MSPTARQKIDPWPWQTDGRMDGCYQVHYFTCFVVENNVNTINPITSETWGVMISQIFHAPSPLVTHIRQLSVKFVSSYNKKRFTTGGLRYGSGRGRWYTFLTDGYHLALDFMLNNADNFITFSYFSTSCNSVTVLHWSWHFCILLWYQSFWRSRHMCKGKLRYKRYTNTYLDQVQKPALLKVID